MWLSQPPNILFHELSLFPSPPQLHCHSWPGNTGDKKMCWRSTPKWCFELWEVKTAGRFLFPLLLCWPCTAISPNQRKNSIRRTRPCPAQNAVSATKCDTWDTVLLNTYCQSPKLCEEGGKRNALSTWVLLFTLSGKFRASCLVLPSAFTTS